MDFVIPSVVVHHHHHHHPILGYHNLLHSAGSTKRITNQALSLYIGMANQRNEFAHLRVGMSAILVGDYFTNDAFIKR